MFTRFMRSNNFTIILAILLALALWLFVVGDTLFQVLPKRKVLEDVPLVYINLDKNLEVTELNQNVSIVLEGLPEVLHDISSENMIAFIDLKGKEPGEHAVEVKVNPPEGLSIISFLPSKVELTIK